MQIKYWYPVLNYFSASSLICADINLITMETIANIFNCMIVYIFAQYAVFLY